MKVSKRCEYAMRTLIDLGIAAEAGRQFLPSTELAAYERLPQKFLEQILHELRSAGLVASRRGKLGGYRLSARAATTPMGEIVRLTDGPLAPIGCVSETAYRQCSCPDENHCGLRMLMTDVRSAVVSVLDRYTLGDVVGVTLRKLRRDGLPVPFARTGSPAS